jgi:hypothetical protein
MKRKETQYLIGGLLVGMLVGALVISVNDSLREGLFGATSNPPKREDEAVEIDPQAFYLVDFIEAQDWLAMIDPGKDQQIRADLDVVGELASAVDISAYFTEDTKEATENSIDAVLAAFHSVLLQAAFDNADDVYFRTCIIVDNSSGTRVLYMYVEMPEEVIGDILEGWEQLNNSQEGSLLLSTQCYQPNKQQGK